MLIQSQQTTTSPNHGPARHFAVVLNRCAGALVGKSDAAEGLRAAFAEFGLTAEFVAPEAGTLPERVALARDSGAEAVVVVGGDGTVACAAQSLAGSTMPLGILPSGTMNLLAKDLGIPVTDLAASVRVLASGVPRAIDVGEVNGRMFLCASMLGLPTRLAKFREAGRGGGTVQLWSRFLRAALRALYASRPMRLGLKIDGVASRNIRTPSLTLTVNPLADRTGRQFGRARLDGGVFGVYIFTRLRLTDLLRIGFSAMRGRWRHDPAVEELAVSHIAISAPGRAMRVMIDGEVVLLKLPLRYRINPGALRVIAPAVAEEPA